jgi:hypothetical protein
MLAEVEVVLLLLAREHLGAQVVVEQEALQQIITQPLELQILVAVEAVEVTVMVLTLVDKAAQAL